MEGKNFIALTNREDRIQEEMLHLIEMAGWKEDPRILGLVQLAVRTGNWEPILKLLRLRFRGVEKTHPFIELPSSDETTGNITLGNLLLPDWSLGDRVGINPEHLNTHMQVCGPTGGGKTWLLKALILQIAFSGVPVFVFDTEDEFKDLAAYLPPRTVLVFDVSKGEFKRNMWQPLPGETFMDTEARLRDVFREVWVGEGGINILSEVALQLHEEQGIFTISQFHERIKKMRGKRGLDWRRQQYLEALINRTSNLVNHLPGTYDVLEGYSLDEITNQCVVFRLSNLSTDLVVFFVIELLSAISDMKLRDTVNTPLVVVFDEAQRFIKPAGYSGTVLGDPAMLDLIRTFRKRSTGMILATQVASELPPVVFGNVATSMFLQTTDGSSILQIGRSLSLSQEQMKFMPEIPQRCALVRYPNFPKPFLVKIPELRLDRTISEEQINKIMAPVLASLKWKPRPNEIDDAMPVRNDRSPDEKKQMTKKERKEKPLAKDETDYLIEVARTPFEPVTERDKRLGLSGYKGDSLRGKLTQRAMVVAHKIFTGRRGGQITILETTPEAWKYLRSIKAGVEPPPGKGGFLHKYYQHQLKIYLDLNHGCEAVIEDMSSGKAVDVSAEIDSERIAYEILVNGVAKEQDNILKDAESYGRIVMLVQDEKQLNELSEWVEAQPDQDIRNKVQITKINDFLNRK